MTLQSHTVATPPAFLLCRRPVNLGVMSEGLELARQHNRNLPVHVREYLQQVRGICAEAIDLHMLGWNGSRITIPIFDRAGQFAFFKLAKGPNDQTDSPKMLATPGGHAQLYGWERVFAHPERVIICEGEFDRLVLESRFTVLLVNAQHLKQVPGRKSDVRDCQWIAQLLQHGLLKGSFIPPRAQRELRDLTRHRTQLVEEKTRTVNRVHKVLEDANIKLASVATDILGVSGRAMLEALMEGQEDPVKLADLAQRQMRGKIPLC